MVRVAGWGQIFFFSSRRRHTRLQGDWSSDVCSSDLEPERLPEIYNAVVIDHRGNGAPPIRLTAEVQQHIGRNQVRAMRSEEHTSELQSPCNLVCRLLLEKKKKKQTKN